MKVLVVADELEPYGGSERSQIDVAEGLAARGHTVDLLHRAGGSFEERYRRICRHVTRIPTLRGREGQRFHRAALLRAALGPGGRRPTSTSSTSTTTGTPSWAGC